MYTPRKPINLTFVLAMLAIIAISWKVLSDTEKGEQIKEAVAATDLSQLRDATPVAPPTGTDNGSDDPVTVTPVEPTAPRPVAPPEAPKTAQPEPEPVRPPVAAAPSAIPATPAPAVKPTKTIKTPFSQRYQTHQPVNMRSGRHPRADVITTLAHGTPVTVIGHASNQWVQVKTADDTSGYVWYEFVR